MKKLLLTALTVAALASCQKESNEDIAPIKPSPEPAHVVYEVYGADSAYGIHYKLQTEDKLIESTTVRDTERIDATFMIEKKNNLIDGNYPFLRVSNVGVNKAGNGQDVTIKVSVDGKYVSQYTYKMNGAQFVLDITYYSGLWTDIDLIENGIKKM